MRWAAIALALAVTALPATQSGTPAKVPSAPQPRAGPQEDANGPGPDRGGPSRRAIAELRRTVSEPSGHRTTVRIGRSAQGRPIRAFAVNGLGSGPLVLVVGCIHGTECAGIEVARRAPGGSPPYGDGMVVVPNLNPDGLALGTRLNANGVDLNRNFRSEWEPIGVPGDLQHSGPQPFSEPESSLARRLIKGLRPDIAIWFHRQAEPPLVRAWGPSVPAARAYARLARTPFHRLPWLAGTAPNWQNHRFPGTSSFVVEFALGDLTRSEAQRHAHAIFRLAQAVGRRPG